MKKHKVKKAFLDELRKIPIIQVACEKVSVSRNSVYRWKNTDKKFSEEMETALSEGEALVNDMTESQLLTLIKEKNYAAISFWLRHRNPRFKEKLEVTAKIQNDGLLTPEQEAVVRQALKLASITNLETNNQTHGTKSTEQSDSPRISGDNDKGSESKDSNH